MILFQTGPLTVSTIDESELPALFEVYKQCEDFLALGPVPRASMEMVRADINHSRDEDGQYCAIRDDQSRIVGVLDFIAPSADDRTGVLSLLMIAATWRGKGYGRAVVGALEEYLRKSYRIERIDAGVQTNNGKAIRFWKGIGYQLSTESCKMPDGTVVYSMTKVL